MFSIRCLSLSPFSHRSSVRPIAFRPTRPGSLRSAGPTGLPTPGSYIVYRDYRFIAWRLRCPPFPQVSRSCVFPCICVCLGLSVSACQSVSQSVPVPLVPSSQIPSTSASLGLDGRSNHPATWIYLNIKPYTAIRNFDLLVSRGSISNRNGQPPDRREKLRDLTPTE